MLTIKSIHANCNSSGPSATVEVKIGVVVNGAEQDVYASNVDGFENYEVWSYDKDDVLWVEEEYGDLDDAVGSEYYEVYKIANTILEYIGMSI